MNTEAEFATSSTPTSYAGVVKIAQFKTRLGYMSACASDAGICLLEFQDAERLPQRIERLKKRSGKPVVPGRHKLHTRLRMQLNEYLSGTRESFDVPLDLDGTDFQLKVWRALLRTRYGQTLTYTELAGKAKYPLAVRAAAAANGSNPLSILVPCHRVKGRNGKLTGYSGGLKRKAWLLDLESTGLVPG